MNNKHKVPHKEILIHIDFINSFINKLELDKDNLDDIKLVNIKLLKLIINTLQDINTNETLLKNAIEKSNMIILSFLSDTIRINSIRKTLMERYFNYIAECDDGYHLIYNRQNSESTKVQLMSLRDSIIYSNDIYQLKKINYIIDDIMHNYHMRKFDEKLWKERRKKIHKKFIKRNEQK